MARIVSTVGLLLAVLFVQALGGQAWAATPAAELRERFAAVNRLLDDPGLRADPEALLGEIRQVVTGAFDFRESARLALGPEWEARTPAEREEFTRLFADLLRHAYLSGIAARVRGAGGLVVRYLGEAVQDDRALVRTTVMGRDGEIPVEYRLLRDRARWLVYDVTVDGVSLVSAYRAQVARLTRDWSYALVVERMRAMVADAPGGTPPSPRTMARPAPASATAVPASLPPTPVTAPTPPAMGRPAPATVHVTPGPVRAVASLSAPRPSAAAYHPADRREGNTQVPAQTPVARRADDDRREVSTHAAMTRRAAVDVDRALTVPAAPAQSYWVQLGAFKDVETAARLAARLLTRNLPVALESVGLPAGLLARVRVGPFADPAEAAAALAALKTGGYQPFLARDTR
jgi:phospholipid transport system substrate-binding protein